MNNKVYDYLSAPNRVDIRCVGKSAYVYSNSGEPIKPIYDRFKSRQSYEEDQVKFIEPMLAKEISGKKSVDEYFDDPKLSVEEKLDGTRATLHMYSNGARVFSRNVSSKTNWLSENSDSLPQFRDMSCCEFAGTILDGEMRIPNRPFKDVSATLNCLWDEAINRQLDLGFVVFNAFDIISYNGEDVTSRPFCDRRSLLEHVVYTLRCPYIRLVDNVQNSVVKVVDQAFIDRFKNLPNQGRDIYPNLSDAFLKMVNNRVRLSKKAYYDYIVYSGGEGVILKDNSAFYECGKRTNAFLKIKKMLTRDVIIMDFALPTKEYQGKLPNTWRYWEDATQTNDAGIHKIVEIKWDCKVPVGIREKIKSKMLLPVSKYYAEQWVGNIIFGVTITDAEISKLPANKKFNIKSLRLEGGVHTKVIEVGECSGFDEQTREMFSSQYITKDGHYVFCRTVAEYDCAERAGLQGVIWQGKVIEVLGNEVFNDTGKIRHPRYNRLRNDKKAIQCTWSNHLNA